MANHTKKDGDAEIARMKQEQRDALAAKKREMKESNPVYQEKRAALASLLRPGMEKLDLNFPPYWKAEEMSGFRAKLLRRDERDRKDDGSVFTRFHWQNTGPGPLDCRRGRVEDGVIETVPVNGIFTTGDFKGLPMDEWYGCEVAVICLEMDKLPGNAESEYVERDFWRFEAHVSTEDKLLIESRKVEDMERRQRMILAAEAQADAEMIRLNTVTKIASKVAAKGNGKSANV